jgi:hypothetical protein
MVGLSIQFTLGIYPASKSNDPNDPFLRRRTEELTHNLLVQTSLNSQARSTRQIRCNERPSKGGDQGRLAGILSAWAPGSPPKLVQKSNIRLRRSRRSSRSCSGLLAWLTKLDDFGKTISHGRRTRCVELGKIPRECLRKAYLRELQHVVSRTRAATVQRFQRSLYPHNGDKMITSRDSGERHCSIAGNSDV